MTILTIYKPIGKTPLDMIHTLKKNKPHLKTTKMSYAGRLDPMAHGLLIILTDEDCFNQHLYHNLDKTYECELLIGISTDTYDILGKITNNKKNLFNLPVDKVISTITSLKGSMDQPYPPYSSQRVSGKPLWYYAKHNLLNTITIPSKIINILSKQNRNIISLNHKKYTSYLTLNSDKVKKKCKWKPKYSVTQSVRVTTEWYKNVLVNKMNIEKITENQIREYMDVS